MKERLRGRYRAALGDPMPGAWTTFEELLGIDLLAFSAWSSPQPRVGGVRYPIIGHEVKVSRNDYRGELLKPWKRAVGTAVCNRFYMVTPAGLLKDEEKAYREPDWLQEHRAEDFERKLCPQGCKRPNVRRLVGIVPNELIDELKGNRKTGKLEGHEEWQRRLYAEQGKEFQERRFIVCETCDGKGYLEKSRIEREVPVQLWVPTECGLIEVHETMTKVVKEAPINRETDPSHWPPLGVLMRWASSRPDPRHRKDEELAEYIRQLPMPSQSLNGRAASVGYYEMRKLKRLAR